MTLTELNEMVACINEQAKRDQINPDHISVFIPKQDGAYVNSMLYNYFPFSKTVEIIPANFDFETDDWDD